MTSSTDTKQNDEFLFPTDGKLDAMHRLLKYSVKCVDRYGYLYIERTSAPFRPIIIPTDTVKLPDGSLVDGIYVSELTRWSDSEFSEVSDDDRKRITERVSAALDALEVAYVIR